MTEEQRPARVFIAYSHEDAEYREEFEKHASMLLRENAIEIWCDKKITPGEEWEVSIGKSLDDSDIFIPLVSPSFLASEYCYSVEMDRALQLYHQRRLTIVPVIVRQCEWERSPIAFLEALPKAANILPVKSWPDADEAWKNVNTGIRRAIGRLDEIRQNSAVLGFITADKSENAAEVIRMVYADRPEATAACRTYMQGFLTRLDELAPKFEPEEKSEERDEKSLKAINDTEELVAEYSAVIQAIAQHDAFDAALEIQKSFTGILKRCYPKGWGIYKTEADFYKFLAHELLVILYAALLDSRGWQGIQQLLSDPHLVITKDIRQVQDTPTIWDLSPAVECLRRIGSQNRRTCYHADLLKERHEKEPLQRYVSFDQFVAADFFLLLSAIEKRTKYSISWGAWSTFYFKENTPDFIMESRSLAVADRLCKTVSAESVEELIKDIKTALTHMDNLFLRGFPSFSEYIPYLGLDEIGKH